MQRAHENLTQGIVLGLQSNDEEHSRTKHIVGSYCKAEARKQGQRLFHLEALSCKHLTAVWVPPPARQGPFLLDFVPIHCHAVEGGLQLYHRTDQYTSRLSRNTGYKVYSSSRFDCAQKGHRWLAPPHSYTIVHHIMLIYVMKHRHPTHRSSSQSIQSP